MPLVDAVRRRFDVEVEGLLASSLALAVGEELWQAFLPAYIVALGGSPTVVGAFGSCRDLLDSVYQLPGGWLSDRFGPEPAIRIFTIAAIAGYAAYAIAPAWPIAFVGLIGAMGWKAGAFPAMFALFGDRLVPGRTAMGFAWHAIAVRVPRVVAAPIGGLLIRTQGVVRGVHVGALVAVVLGVAVASMQRHALDATPRRRAPSGWTWPTRELRRLLAAECLVRIGEAIAASFLVLYVTQVRGVALSTFGWLYALQQAVALAVSIPAARFAAHERQLIALTFAFFAIHPLAVIAAPGTVGLAAAFVAGGLKEVGEPTRKASIVDRCRPAARAREVGTYYTIRNLLVVPGGVIGAVLWRHRPALVLMTAAAVSAAGLFVFLATVAECRPTCRASSSNAEARHG